MDRLVRGGSSLLGRTWKSPGKSGLFRAVANSDAHASRVADAAAMSEAARHQPKRLSGARCTRQPPELKFCLGAQGAYSKLHHDRMALWDCAVLALASCRLLR